MTTPQLPPLLDDESADAERRWTDYETAQQIARDQTRLEEGRRRIEKFLADFQTLFQLPLDQYGIQVDSPELPYAPISPRLRIDCGGGIVLLIEQDAIENWDVGCVLDANTTIVRRVDITDLIHETARDLLLRTIRQVFQLAVARRQKDVLHDVD